MKHIFALLGASALIASSPSSAQSRYEVSVTRKAKNSYKVDGLPYWIKTKYCYEYARFEDSILSNDQIIFLDADSKCDVDKIYKEIFPKSGNYQVSLTIEEDSYSTLDGFLFNTPFCFQYAFAEDAIFKSTGYGGGTLIFIDSGETCEVEQVLSETRL